MHLSPATLEASISLLERREINPNQAPRRDPRSSEFGDILETRRR